MEDFTKPIPTVLFFLSKSNFVDLLKLKTNFIAKSQLLYMVCSLMRERKQKKNPIFIFKVSAYERVSAYESVR